MELRDIPDIGNLVLPEIRGEYFAALVVGEVLDHAVAHAHDHRAVDLPLVGQRIQDLSGVVRGGEFLHPHFAGLRVDFNLGDLRHQRRFRTVGHIDVVPFGD